MRLFHICAKKVFEQNGEKKIKWYRAGILKETDSGRKYIRFFHLPEVDYFVLDGQPANAENKSEELSA